MKHDAIVEQGIPIYERVPIPDYLIPEDSRVEIDAKIHAGYCKSFIHTHYLHAHIWRPMQSLPGQLWVWRNSPRSKDERGMTSMWVGACLISQFLLLKFNAALRTQFIETAQVRRSYSCIYIKLRFESTTAEFIHPYEFYLDLYCGLRRDLVKVATNRGENMHNISKS